MKKNEKVVSEEQFVGWRKIFFPIHHFEIRKCLSISLLLFCIIFIYNLLRNLKDTLMVSKAVCGGAEMLGFLKLYLVTPSAILTTLIFVKLANTLEREKLFYTIVMFFLTFLITFGFVLYPMHSALHFSENTILSLQSHYPKLHWIFPIIGNWSFSLFYIFTELWGNVVLCTLFWQFANEKTNVKESKRFYPLFIMIGQTGQVIAGIVAILCTYFARTKGAMQNSAPDVFGTNLFYQMMSVLIIGMIGLGIYRWINNNVCKEPELYNDGAESRKNKPKLGVIKSFNYIIKSPYLLMITVILLSYGVSINLIEAVWKTQLKELCPDANEYNTWMGNLSIATGALTVTLAIVANNLFRKFSWKVVALITPVILLVTSILFYGFVLYKNNVGSKSQLMGFSVLFLAVLVGFIQNSLSKGTKYTLFDSTKQMAYIPLDAELKVKGQAAIEILAERGGKSGGAFIQSTLLMIVGGGVKLSSLVDILGTIVMVVVVLWIISVLGLSKRFEALTAEKEKTE